MSESVAYADIWQEADVIDGGTATPKRFGTSPATSEQWRVAHEQLTRLARSRAGLDFEEGRWLVAALRRGTHLRLGYGSFVEYAERLFGYSPKLTQDKLRVAEALETLPALAEGLRSGEICWSVVRELTRVATSATEREWLSAASGRTVREVERLVSGHVLGSGPCDERDTRAERHVLRFEVSGEVLASFREAMGRIRRDAGETLDDDTALLLMARQVLEGPRDEGRSSYQVAVTVCDRCQRATQLGRGEQVEVGLEIVEMAACDGQHIGSLADAQVGVGSTGSPMAANGNPSPSPRRATQDISPATRRLVLRRDRGRCVFPGCRHATFVDLHHLRARAEGGSHEPDNLVTLCSAHHRAVHRGHASIEGSVGSGLRARHADGTSYGGTGAPGTVDLQAKPFRALRALGFGEAETRRALGQVAHVGAESNVELVVRRCLLLLTERAVQASTAQTLATTCRRASPTNGSPA